MVPTLEWLITEGYSDLAKERIVWLREFLANHEEECRCHACWREALGYVLDGAERP